MTQTVHEVIREATRRLIAAGIENARLDVEVLLMHVMNVDRAHLYLALPDPAPDDLATELTMLVKRREAGEPVAYLTGHREFMGLDFQVDSRVLIPRPETEGLVERAVRWLQVHPDAGRVVDVGTGSGAIAISIDKFASPSRELLISGSDVSRATLDVARDNRTRLGAMRVELVNGNLLDWCGQRIDLIVANLPYLREEQRHEGIAQEPDLALYADEAGFALHTSMIGQAANLLTSAGALMCEIDPSQSSVANATAPGFSQRAHPDRNGSLRPRSVPVVERRRSNT